jgi:hypothetical protein
MLGKAGDICEEDGKKGNTQTMFGARGESRRGGPTWEIQKRNKRRHKQRVAIGRRPEELDACICWMKTVRMNEEKFGSSKGTRGEEGEC